MRVKSIRVLTVLMSISLVLFTGTTSLSLSRYVSDKALSDAQASLQRAVEYTITSASVAVQDVTETFLDAQASAVHHYTMTALKQQKRLANSIVSFLQPLANRAHPTAGVELLDFYIVREKFRVAASLAPEFDTLAIAFTNRNAQTIQVRRTSFARNATSYTGIFNNGTYLGGGGDHRNTH
eukprot:PhM_4_TR9184/c0_g1_i1/m.67714